MFAWLRTLPGLGQKRDVRAEIPARPVVYVPPLPHLAVLRGEMKPHLRRVYSVVHARTVWHASLGLYAGSGDTPTEAYYRLMACSRGRSS